MSGEFHNTSISNTKQNFPTPSIIIEQINAFIPHVIQYLPSVLTPNCTTRSLVPLPMTSLHFRHFSFVVVVFFFITACLAFIFLCSDCQKFCNCSFPFHFDFFQYCLSITISVLCTCSLHLFILYFIQWFALFGCFSVYFLGHFFLFWLNSSLIELGLLRGS